MGAEGRADGVAKPVLVFGAGVTRELEDARMLLSTLLGIFALPGTAGCAWSFAQHVVFVSFKFRGQTKPFEQKLSCIDSNPETTEKKRCQPLVVRYPGPGVQSRGYGAVR